MEGLPDDIFQHDVNTFPKEDPKIAEMRSKAEAAYLKEKAADDKRKATEIKNLEKAVKATPAKKPVETAKEAKAAASSAAGDFRKRELKLRKIRLYFQKLGDKLSVKEPKTYPKTDEAVDELLAEIESDLHSKGGIQQAGIFYINGCVAIEQISNVFNPLGWDLTGPATSLSATVAANRKQWDDLITEFAISNAEWFMLGPTKRLIGLTVQMILAVDGANKTARARQADAPASADLQAQASDL